MRRRHQHANDPDADGHQSAANDTNAGARTSAGAGADTGPNPGASVNVQPDRIVDGAFQRSPWLDGRADAPHSNWYVDFRDSPIRSDRRRHDRNQFNQRLDFRQRRHDDRDPRGPTTQGREHNYDYRYRGVLTSGDKQHGDVGVGRFLDYGDLQRHCVVPGANHHNR